jgi:hypothetical protein
MCPFLGIDGDHVGVGHHEQRPLPPVALEPSHHVHPVGLRLEQLHRDAFALEHLLQILGRRTLVAGRIAGVDSQDRLEVAHGLLFQGRKIRFGPALRRQGDGTEAGEQQDHTPHRTPPGRRRPAVRESSMQSAPGPRSGAVARRGRRRTIIRRSTFATRSRAGVRSARASSTRPIGCRGGARVRC